MFKNGLILISLMLSSNAFSAGGTFTGKITEILGGPGHGSNIYLSVEGGSSNVTGSCATDARYMFSLDTSNPLSNTWVSMILSAYAAGKIVYIQGTGACGGNVEHINQIRLM
jgi:hypothetical protein